MNTHPTRTRILEAALELLGRAGPDGFSASALAREAGVSKATLFHHFAALDEVPLAAFESLWLALLDRPALDDLPLRDYLELLGAEVQQLARERRTFLSAYFVFLNRALFDPRMRERLLAGSATLQQTLSAGLTAHLPASTDPNRVELTARLLGLALDGLGLHLLLSDEPALSAAWRHFAALITRSLE